MDSHHQHPTSETGVLLIELQGNGYRIEHRKMVSAAGLAPAFPRSQAECVGCYAARCSPRGASKEAPGVMVLVGWRTLFPGIGSQTRLADPEGVAPSTLPQTTGRSADGATTP